MGKKTINTEFQLFTQLRFIPVHMITFITFLLTSDTTRQPTYGFLITVDCLGDENMRKMRCHTKMMVIHIGQYSSLICDKCTITHKE